MKRLIFVRHGESEYNAGMTKEYDSRLTSLGQEQTRATGKYLKTYSKLTGFVSPYLRALQTAEIIGKETDTKFSVSEGCREWPLEVPNDHRQVSCKDKDFLDFTWSQTKFDWTAVPHNVYMSTLQEFVNSLPDNALVVSHQTTIEQMIFLCADLKKMPSRRDYYIHNASVSIIEDGCPVTLGQKPDLATKILYR